MAKITITTQPANVSTKFGEIDEQMSIAASAGAEVITYKWYLAAKADLSDAAQIAGQATATLTIPTTLEGGTYYVYCVMTASTYEETTSAVAVLLVGGDIPALAGYITGAYVHECLSNADADVRARFTEACARTGITIPDTSAVLRTAQVELFMSIL